MKITVALKWVQEAFLDLLFPPHCVACQQPGAWLCPTCLASLQKRKGLEPLAPHFATEDLAGAFAGFPYVYPIREAIHALKYDGMRVLAKPLAALLVERWHVMLLPVDVALPVPLHPLRVRERGYNQSALIARAFCDMVGIPIAEGVLVRQRSTHSQVSLSVEERCANVQGAFRCVRDHLQGKRVLLIDDVFTTGATMAACASAIRQAGAEAVWGLAVSWATLHGSSDAIGM